VNGYDDLSATKRSIKSVYQKSEYGPYVKNSVYTYSLDKSTQCQCEYTCDLQELSNGSESIIRSIHTWEEKDKIFIETTVVNCQMSFNPDAELFTLTYYGFPEPEGVVWEKPTPRWVWYLSICGGALLLALLVSWIIRRRVKARGTIVDSLPRPPGTSV
jgi:hypothetical protein